MATTSTVTALPASASDLLLEWQRAAADVQRFTTQHGWEAQIDRGVEDREERAWAALIDHCQAAGMRRSDAQVSALLTTHVRPIT